MTTGYSDRINHAFAFAAKHHDRQVRKGTGLPYLTRPASVAIILTRYGCDETAVVAGILHDVVEDCVRDGWTRDLMDDRIGEKFGADVLEILLSVVQRRVGDTGAELAADERRSDCLQRLTTASNLACWVMAACVLHEGSSLLTDLRRTVDANVVWGRFKASKSATVAWYRAVPARLGEVGFSAPIVAELDQLARALEASAKTPLPPN